MAANPFGGGTREKKSSSSTGSSRSTPRFGVPNGHVVDLIVGAVSFDEGQADGEYHWFPFRRDSPDALPVSELPEPFAEELDGVIEDTSFESFFGIELAEAVKYINEPVVSRDEVEADENYDEDLYDDRQMYSHGNPDNGPKDYIPPVEWAESVDSDEVAPSGLTYHATKTLNAWYFPEIWQAFGEGTKLKMGARRDKDYETLMDKWDDVAFMVEDTDNSRETVFDWAVEEGSVDRDEISQLNNGDITLGDLQEIVKERREAELSGEEEEEAEAAA